MRNNNTEKYNEIIVYIGVWAHFLKIIAAWNYMSALQLFIIFSWFECIYSSTLIYVRQTSAIDLFENRRLNQTISNTTKESKSQFPWVKIEIYVLYISCLLYTSDAADDTPCVDLGGRRIIKSGLYKH